MRISDWSSDVCSSGLPGKGAGLVAIVRHRSQCFCHSGPCLHRACHRVQPRRRLDEVTDLRTAGPLREDESIGVTERETALKHARPSGNFALPPPPPAVEHPAPGSPPNPTPTPLGPP